jgi:hypothetical protein
MILKCYNHLPNANLACKCSLKRRFAKELTIPIRVPQCPDSRYGIMCLWRASKLDQLLISTQMI